MFTTEWIQQQMTRQQKVELVHQEHLWSDVYNRRDLLTAFLSGQINADFQLWVILQGADLNLQRLKQKHVSVLQLVSLSARHCVCVCVCVCVWPHSSCGCWEIWDVNAEPFVSSSFLWEMFFLPSFCHPRHLVSTSGLNGTAGSYFKVGSRSDTQPRPPQTRRSTTTQLRGGGM